jgi:transcriptional regulator with XRE-family HTH domain
VTPNGTAIRAIREARQIGLRALAHLTDLNRGYLSRLERGLAGASADTIRRIATALAVSPADITRGDTVSTTDQVEQEIPHPTSPEGQIFLYTPAQASKFLNSAPLTIKRRMYARLIPYTPTDKGHRISGRQICELIASAEVRPLAETKRDRRKTAA